MIGNPVCMHKRKKQMLELKSGVESSFEVDFVHFLQDIPKPTC